MRYCISPKSNQFCSRLLSIAAIANLGASKAEPDLAVAARLRWVEMQLAKGVNPMDLAVRRGPGRPPPRVDRWPAHFSWAAQDGQTAFSFEHGAVFEEVGLEWPEFTLVPWVTVVEVLHLEPQELRQLVKLVVAELAELDRCLARTSPMVESEPSKPVPSAGQRYERDRKAPAELRTATRANRTKRAKAPGPARPRCKRRRAQVPRG